MKLGKSISLVSKDQYRKEYAAQLLDFIASDERLRVLEMPSKQVDSTYEIVGGMLSRDRKLGKEEQRFTGIDRFVHTNHSDGKRYIYLMKEHGT